MNKSTAKTIRHYSELRFGRGNRTAYVKVKAAHKAMNEADQKENIAIMQAALAKADTNKGSVKR